MKIRVSNKATLWRVLLLLTWLLVIVACVIHSMSSFFQLDLLRDIGRGVFVPVYAVMLVLTLVFSFFTAVYLAKGLLTWLDK